MTKSTLNISTVEAFGSNSAFGGKLGIRHPVGFYRKRLAKDNRSSSPAGQASHPLLTSPYNHIAAFRRGIKNI